MENRDFIVVIDETEELQHRYARKSLMIVLDEYLPRTIKEEQKEIINNLPIRIQGLSKNETRTLIKGLRKIKVSTSIYNPETKSWETENNNNLFNYNENDKQQILIDTVKTLIKIINHMPTNIADYSSKEQDVLDTFLECTKQN